MGRASKETRYVRSGSGADTISKAIARQYLRRVRACWTRLYLHSGEPVQP